MVVTDLDRQGLLSMSRTAGFSPAIPVKSVFFMRITYKHLCAYGKTFP